MLFSGLSTEKGYIVKTIGDRYFLITDNYNKIPSHSLDKEVVISHMEIKLPNCKEIKDLTYTITNNEVLIMIIDSKGYFYLASVIRDLTMTNRKITFKVFKNINNVVGNLTSFDDLPNRDLSWYQ